MLCVLVFLGHMETFQEREFFGDFDERFFAIHS